MIVFWGHPWEPFSAGEPSIAFLCRISNSVGEAQPIAECRRCVLYQPSMDSKATDTACAYQCNLCFASNSHSSAAKNDSHMWWFRNARFN
jgi:hypothetical protein